MYFCCRDVKTDILNEKKQAPIHLVTELNKVAVLKVMGRHKEKINIQQGGEHGRTALHIAAIYDHEECARVLVWFYLNTFHVLCSKSVFCVINLQLISFEIKIKVVHKFSISK